MKWMQTTPITFGLTVQKKGTTLERVLFAVLFYECSRGKQQQPKQQSRAQPTSRGQQKQFRTHPRGQQQ